MHDRAFAEYPKFQGQHCETTATGNLLAHLGITLTEPMMFGLAEGLQFIFLNLQGLNLPFIGGRTKPFELTRTLCVNLNLALDSKETSSRAKAWDNLIEPLKQGIPVGLQLDAYYLHYFSTRIHFAGHAVACFGIDGTKVHVMDTLQQGGVQQIALSDLEQARFAKGPMAAKARSWTITSTPDAFSLDTAIKSAIRNNAAAYLAPAFKGMSYLGIEKLAKSLPTWLNIAQQPAKDLVLASMLMERAGTGGSIFRCFYRDFLAESSQIVGTNIVKDAHEAFKGIADDWRQVALLIEEAATSLTSPPLIKAASICETLAVREKAAMTQLSQL